LILYFRFTTIGRFHIVMAIFLSIYPICTQSQHIATNRPNVVLIVTDDQGYGDIGYHQNKDISTPFLDSFADQSISFNNFYVTPVCSPSRASIMTGRYNIRTGVFDTLSGGGIMASSETTLAEILNESGYRTGQFGKWHLGNNYPSRPQDQGFETSVWNIGGGLGSPGDWLNYHKRDSSYFNPIVWKNGEIYQSVGYCSDVWTNEAIEFINFNKNEPFFVYLAYNAPHKPLQLPQEYYDKYKDKEINQEYYRDLGFYVHEMTEKDKEDARKVYGMVTNIDDNLGRLFGELKALNLYENTIIIFMSDNGPAQYRYIGGYRGKKSLVDEGGIHVPFYLKTPSSIAAVNEVEERFAHIDILPTIAAMCDIQINDNLRVDGVSMVPFFTQSKPTKLERPLFFEWQRSYPEKYKNMAVIHNGYKLIGNAPEDAPINNFELYNLDKDPFESHNLVEDQSDIAVKLKKEIDVWYEDIMQSYNIKNLPEIIIGNENQNTIYLNRNDARGIQEIRAQENLPFSWDVVIENPGYYRVSCHFINKIDRKGKLYFRVGSKNVSMENQEIGVEKLVFDKVALERGKFKIDSWYSINIESFLTPFYIEIEKLNDNAYKP